MKKYGAWISGVAAGIINGLFGAGGGMVLLPLLDKTTDLEGKEVFANCVAIILPISLVSAVVYFLRGGSFAMQSIPYLIGGALGGVIAGLLLKKMKAKWLHRALGLFIIWGGIRLVMR
ncbi:MAG: sulfite exporter TauE/SafE family protein [Ruminococcaceae bacterium]|nr:sulfite exporter TauE/SafE family protein [Oscillospiraceae bacterium]